MASVARTAVEFSLFCCQRVEVKVASPNCCTDVIMHSDAWVKNQYEVSDGAGEWDLTHSNTDRLQRHLRLQCPWSTLYGLSLPIMEPQLVWRHPSLGLTGDSAEDSAQSQWPSGLVESRADLTSACLSKCPFQYISFFHDCYAMFPQGTTTWHHGRYQNIDWTILFNQCAHDNLI